MVLKSIACFRILSSQTKTYFLVSNMDIQSLLNPLPTNRSPSSVEILRSDATITISELDPSIHASSSLAMKEPTTDPANDSSIHQSSHVDAVISAPETSFRDTWHKRRRPHLKRGGFNRPEPYQARSRGSQNDRSKPSLTRGGNTSTRSSTISPLDATWRSSHSSSGSARADFSSISIHSEAAWFLRRLSESPEGDLTTLFAVKYSADLKRILGLRLTHIDRMARRLSKSTEADMNSPKMLAFVRGPADIRWVATSVPFPQHLNAWEGSISYRQLVCPDDAIMSRLKEALRQSNEDPQHWTVKEFNAKQAVTKTIGSVQPTGSPQWESGTNQMTDGIDHLPTFLPNLVITVELR